MTPTMEKASGLRGQVQKLVESALFRNTITILIVVNAVTLGLDTFEAVPPEVRYGLRIFDFAVIVIFAIELALKIYAWGLNFFRSGWNIFDFVIVSLSILPGAHAFQVLRSLRVLRILRLLHVVPMMKRIVEALFKALPGMGAILAVLGVLVYAGSVMATTLYGRTDDPDVHALFHDLPASAFTLFQVMTMDGWRNEVVQKVMDDGHPYAWIFFLIFIFLASFAVLNLFIALIVDALQAEQEAQQEEAIEHIEDAQEEARRESQQLMALVKDLKDDIADLKAQLNKS
ncbi:ion transporter [Ponticaulis profundi]|uniref:Ion transporter n=1 Tax=Ponticaulis profundi TaxID=2665222 RepID=A0ABW1S5Z8_9PROT